MKAVIVNCTLKASPEESNTAALAGVLADALHDHGVEVDEVRAVDRRLPPGVASDEGEGDEWPGIRARILDAEILVVASPTWLGRPSSVAQRVLERMDAMLGETDEEERPVAYNHVAGVVVTGNEDGAHHVISEISGALCDLGFTVPGQSWTYWNRGPGPGDSYLEDEVGREWSHSTARAAASNLVAVARALSERPVPPPPGQVEEPFVGPAGRALGEALAGAGIDPDGTYVTNVVLEAELETVEPRAHPWRRSRR